MSVRSSWVISPLCLVLAVVFGTVQAGQRRCDEYRDPADCFPPVYRPGIDLSGCTYFGQGAEGLASSET